MNKSLLIAKNEGKLREFLSSHLNPDQFVRVYSATRSWFLDLLSTSNPKVEAPIKQTEVYGVRFRNDLLNAAGMDKDGELLSFNYLAGAGGAVVGTTLSDENEGNRIKAFGKYYPPWTPLPKSNSAINTLGLPSQGIDIARHNIEEFRWKYQPSNFPIIINIMEHPLNPKNKKEGGLIYCLKRALYFSDMIEINVSCPNVSHSESISDLERKVKLARSIRDNSQSPKYIPIFYKVAKVNPLLVEVLTRSGADGISFSNSQTSYEELRERINPSDIRIFDYYTERFKGGVTGEAIKEIVDKGLNFLVGEIERTNSHLQIIATGALKDYFDMYKRRTLSQKIKLQTWYTGFFHALAKKPIEIIYPSMIGEKYHLPRAA